MNLRIIISIVLFYFANAISAQLYINEVSQGTGNKEYIELIVVGTPNCNDSTVNLQGWILDDNCGFFGTVGIAGGHIKFANDPQWTSIKYGTLITIYRGDDVFPGIVADETDANNDNKYVLPSSSNFFDKNIVIPISGSTIASYPSSGYTSGGGLWQMLGMANGSDVFQTVNPNNLTSAFHSVGWGSGISGADIHFPVNASGLSFVNQNLVNNDPRNQANWVSVDAATQGTASSLNSPPNGNWISFLLSQTSSSAAPITNNFTNCTNNPLNVGIVKDTIQTSLGCDSIYNITNTYLVSTTSNSINTCTNNSSQVGMSSDTIFSIGGCDSIYKSTNIYLVTPIAETINCGNCSAGVDTVYSTTGCDSIYLTTIVNNSIAINIPTAFTPNGDGLNDVFRIVNENDFQNIILKVYNRWGDLVFQSNNTIKAWDGFYKNVKQQVDTYIYYISAIEKTTLEKTSISGTVTLIK